MKKESFSEEYTFFIGIFLGFLLWLPNLLLFLNWLVVVGFLNFIVIIMLSIYAVSTYFVTIKGKK